MCHDVQRVGKVHALCSSIKLDRLEKRVQDEIRGKLKGQPLPTEVYFNKGL